MLLKQNGILCIDIEKSNGKSSRIPSSARSAPPDTFTNPMFESASRDAIDGIVSDVQENALSRINTFNH